MNKIIEITEKHEKVYIMLKNIKSKRRFIEDALKHGVLFTNASLPYLDISDDIIALYSDRTIARLGWAGRIHFYNDKAVIRIEY